MRVRTAARLLQIQRALVRHGLDDFIRATHLYRPFRFLFYLSPWTWFQRSAGVTRGERLRLALEELGPIFVKFGQAVSTRRDLIPADIADELEKLQDRVPPFPSAIAVSIVEMALGRRVSELFESFDETPLAAASIAQVHAARLKSGEDVVVKVLRPGMHEVIEGDLEVLQTLARLADEYWTEARRLRPTELVDEYRKTILDELDLMREAANAAQLKRNFLGSPLLYVPAVYWDYCRSNVMVMERIHGIIISRIEELRARGTNIARLAENGVEIFFTQVFRHNFFHADMHPGNIFVQIDDPQNPRYAAIDFGIVGTLQPRDQHYLASNFLAFFERDYARVAALHLESGWVPRTTRVDELESAVRTVCEPIFNKPLKEISFAQVLLRLFDTARRFDMQIQPQLILLQKTLLNIEGLGRELYPELDLWKTAQPILKQWMRERMSPRALLKRARAQLPDTVEALKELPRLFQSAVREASEGRLRLQVDNQGLSELRRELKQSDRRRDAALAAAVLWLSGSVWLVGATQLRWFALAQLIAAAGLLAWYRSLRWQTK
ncbi:MAG TPA: ubiquinone biosynthesis regulatory protein kinase UbiB [Steroidobacteraceae bacterium]|jgi:ubiquinone biosynthesis protein|nr:ubiquinone biosynthesis regulatory protein kinase UbiB [Steroidobacteraceae bacterium]